MKGNIMFLLYMLSVNALCVDLYLPLTDKEKYEYNDKYLHVDSSCKNKVYGITCSNEFFVGLNGNIIRRVFYKGNEIFSDKKRKWTRYNRVVNFSTYKGRTSIGIHPEGRYHTYEAFVYIANNTIYDLIQLLGLVSFEDGLIANQTPGKLISTMYHEVHKYDPNDKQLNHSGKGDRDKTYGWIPDEIISYDINMIFKRKIIRECGLYEEDAIDEGCYIEVEDEDEGKSIYIRP